MAPYAVTILLGAFLLFQIEPLMGKYVLPWFGGAPAVWSTCLVFFQIVLLAGYLYAHGLAAGMSPRTARALHATLLVLSVSVLAALALSWGSPILPGASWKPRDPGEPIGRILLLLAASVGLPFLLLSSTSPLVQAWAARTHPGARVYRFYALSNFGSVLALITYPTLVERFLPLRFQAWIWTGTYAIFAAASLAWLFRLPVPQFPSLPVTGSSPVPVQFTIHNSQFATLFWFSLSAAGSMLLMAATNQICQEVASIPFLWVLPLCLYLLTFILCFHSERLYNRAVFGPLLVAALGWAAVTLYKGFPVPVRTQIAAYSAALFAACMVCHGELARSKPAPSRLTSFYLTVAAGGAAGGIFVALLAPLLFRGFWEFHLALVLAGALAILALVHDETSWLSTGRPWPAFLVLLSCAATLYGARDPDLFSSATARGLSLRFFLSSTSGLLALGAGVAGVALILRLRLLTARGRPFLAGACLAGALTFVAMLLLAEIQSSLVSAVATSRNFYGVLTIERLAPGIPDSERLELRHGRIVHGFQYTASDKRRIPTTYYTETSGIGLALEHHPLRDVGPLRVGVVGLGVGTLASYGRAGDSYRFYDINPAVIELSTAPARLFSYLADSKARVEIVPGDARLSLEREISSGSPRDDILAVDAFTSDAIPVHLLTKEAIGVFLTRLAPGGILALHISNRQLDLQPVVRSAAAALSLPLCMVDRSSQGEAIWGTTWALLSRDPASLAVPAIAAACTKLDPAPLVRLWTDDYSNLFAVMK
jgi:spermidine synthase